MKIAKTEKREQYYVGIGASAGGLEALEAFFEAVPENNGLIFIVIQHLSPDFKSLMDELLARHTRMKIQVAENGMKTETDHVYLIPPRQNMTIFNGALYLEEQSQRHLLNLPIDIFFRSLAQDQGKQAIGVILSGTGSDGTLGVRAIKEAGGMVMVQDEKTAKFDGMPRSSISTGLVDYVLPPGNMPEEILNYIQAPSLPAKYFQRQEKEEAGLDDLTRISMIIRASSGIDFSSYKENTMIRRIDRRVKVNKLNSLPEYIKLLQSSEKEKETLQRELLIGVTAFFRDKEAYQVLLEKVIKKMELQGKTIRIWSAGCSTGEEVYSLAILLKEHIEKESLNCELKIFATDVDSRALDFTGKGYYSESIIGDLEPELVAKYFVKYDEGYQISEAVRKDIVFAKHNVLKDPPFSKIDILVCRNLFIYLKSEFQQKVLTGFYYALNKGGYLFLGSSESIGELSGGFEIVDSKWKIYKYREGYQPNLMEPLHYSNQRRNNLASHDLELASMKKEVRMDKLLHEAVSAVLPPSLIIDAGDNIIRFINDVSDFIRVQPGRFSGNFNNLLDKEQALYINNLLRRIRKEKSEVRINGVNNFTGTGEAVNLKGRLLEVEGAEYYLISIQPDKGEASCFVNAEANLSQEADERIKQLEYELQLSREGLQATVEELETSNEELQSSNEELIASNEELQSTNEELQSVNEELFTVNNEYQSKIEELVKLNNDLNNLIKNTDVGALYLDNKLCIRKLTPVVTRVTNIREGDLGRPISHIAAMETYPELSTDINRVLDTLQGMEREINAADGKSWLVRIRPYRTEYNAAEGIIVALIDITELNRKKREVETGKERLARALALRKMAWWEYDLVSGYVSYSDEKATMLGYHPDEFPNDVYEICKLIHPEDYEQTMQSMRDYMEGKAPEWNIIYRIKKKNGGYTWFHDKGEIVERDEKGRPLKIIGSVTDVSEYKDLDFNREEGTNQ